MCTTDKSLTLVSEQTRVSSQWRKRHCDRGFSVFFRIFQTSDQLHCRFLCKSPFARGYCQNFLTSGIYPECYAVLFSLFLFLSLFLRPSIHPPLHLYDCVYVCPSVSLYFFLCLLCYLIINRCELFPLYCVDWHYNCRFYLVTGFLIGLNVPHFSNTTI
jgi:hypothetical protein